MRWQDALTKKELAHLRWSRDGATPSLQAFIELREYQDTQRVRRAKAHLYAPLCVTCDEIEQKLKDCGKL